MLLLWLQEEPDAGSHQGKVCWRNLESEEFANRLLEMQPSKRQNLQQIVTKDTLTLSMTPMLFISATRKRVLDLLSGKKMCHIEGIDLSALFKFSR
jgi:hypothetical protein